MLRELDVLRVQALSSCHMTGIQDFPGPGWSAQKFDLNMKDL